MNNTQFSYSNAPFVTGHVTAGDQAKIISGGKIDPRKCNNVGEIGGGFYLMMLEHQGDDLATGGENSVAGFKKIASTYHKDDPQLFVWGLQSQALQHSDLKALVIDNVEDFNHFYALDTHDKNAIVQHYDMSIGPTREKLGTQICVPDNNRFAQLLNNSPSVQFDLQGLESEKFKAPKGFQLPEQLTDALDNAFKVVDTYEDGKIVHGSEDAESSNDVDDEKSDDGPDLSEAVQQLLDGEPEEFAGALAKFQQTGTAITADERDAIKEKVKDLKSEGYVSKSEQPQLLQLLARISEA